jgi:hypothetical protein
MVNGLAYEIISRLKALNENKVLMQLQEVLSGKQIEKGGITVGLKKALMQSRYITIFFLQKLQYIHLNLYVESGS